jgi:hypothetical protein
MSPRVMSPRMPPVEEVPHASCDGSPRTGVDAQAEAAWAAFADNAPTVSVTSTGDGTVPLQPRGQGNGVADGAARLEDVLTGGDDGACGLVELALPPVLPKAHLKVPCCLFLYRDFFSDRPFDNDHSFESVLQQVTSIAIFIRQEKVQSCHFGPSCPAR